MTGLQGRAGAQASPDRVTVARGRPRRTHVAVLPARGPKSIVERDLGRQRGDESDVPVSSWASQPSVPAITPSYSIPDLGREELDARIDRDRQVRQRVLEP